MLLKMFCKHKLQANHTNKNRVNQYIKKFTRFFRIFAPNSNQNNNEKSCCNP